MLMHRPLERMPTYLSLLGTVDLIAMVAFCSALAINKTIDAVQFAPPSPHDVDRDFPFEIDLTTYWKWVAYSVFSTAATTNAIDYVDIDVFTLDATHVAAMKQVVNAKNPFTAMVPQPDEHAIRKDQVQVEVQPYATLFRVQGRADNTEQPAVLTTGPLVESLTVVDEVSKRHHMGVMYRGAGVCWVRKEDIMTRHVTPINSKKPRLLQRLGITLNKDTPLDALLALIQLLGQAVRQLDWDKRRDDKECVLKGHARGVSESDSIGLDGLVCVKVFVASQQPRSFEIEATLVPCKDLDGYPRLLSALGSQGSNPISYTSEDLCLQIPSWIWEPWWDIVFAMLDTNTHLHRLLIASDSEDPSSTLDASVVVQLAAYHGDLLHVRKASLAMKLKLAFLSSMDKVFSASLDAAVVSIIFSFAAPNKQRICGLLAVKEFEELGV